MKEEKKKRIVESKSEYLSAISLRQLHFLEDTFHHARGRSDKFSAFPRLICFLYCRHHFNHYRKNQFAEKKKNVLQRKHRPITAEKSEQQKKLKWRKNRESCVLWNEYLFFECCRMVITKWEKNAVLIKKVKLDCHSCPMRVNERSSKIFSPVWRWYDSGQNIVRD